MNPNLRPETAHAIQRFGSRRQRLLWLRAACSFFVAVLLGWMALAALDRAVLLPDQARWGLSLLVYAGAAVLAWFTSLRLLFGTRGRRAMARLLERADPDLHEQLLSAVELAEDDGGGFDSAAFRERLQSNVATKAAQLNVTSLLPTKRLAGWFAVALLALAGLATLLLVPGWHFPQLIARAALPFVNLARPADTFITLVEPAPADRIVPFHEVVPLVVELDGRLPDRVLLETLNANGQRNRIELIRERENRFLGSIRVAEQSVRYRVQAGRAITRYHELDARQRPSVVQFAKTYHYPEYTGLAPRKIDESHGDLAALEGSLATLRLEVNQPIESGTLLLDPSQHDAEPQPIKIGPSEGGFVEVDVPIERSHDSYQIHLVASESGLLNDQPPAWSIQTLADLPPTVAWIDPTVRQLEVRPGDQFEGRARAADDVALRGVFHEFRISGGDWTRVPLADAEGREIEVPLDWSLGTLSLADGDIVLTRLVAIDALGTEGESATLRLLVVEDLQDPAKREFAAAQTRLDAQLQELTRDARTLSEATTAAQESLRKPAEERDAEQQRQLMQAQDKTEAVAQRMDDVDRALREAMENAPGRVEQQELRAVGERLAEMRAQPLQRTRQSLQRENPANPDRNAQRARDESRDLLARAERLSGQFGQIASEDNAVLAGDTLERLRSQQQDIADGAREQQATEELPERLRDQQQAAIERAEQATADLRDLESTAGGREAARAREMAEALAQQALEVTEALEADDAPQQLPAPAAELSQQSEKFARAADELAQHFQRRAAEARKQLMQDRHESLAKAVQQARKSAEQLARQMEQDGLTADNPEPMEPSQRVAESAEHLQDALNSAAQQAREQAALHEVAPTASPQQVADEARMARALDQLARPQNQPQTAEEAQQTAEAIAALENAQRALAADAEASDLADGLSQLQRQERFSRDPETQQQQSPAEWQQLQQQMDNLPRAIEQSPIDNSLAQQARENARSEPARDLQQQMQQRRQQAGQEQEAAPNTRAAAKDLAQLRQQVDEIRSQMAEDIDSARDLLAQAAPSVPELMRDLAENLQQQEQQAAAAAGDARADTADPQEVAGQAESLLPEATAAEATYDQILDALRQEAGAADLTKEQDRREAWASDVAANELARQPSQAAEHLEQAARADNTAEQADSLEAAAAGQQQLAATLDQLANALEGIASAEPEAAAAAAQELAARAQESGAAEELTENFQRAEDLAEMFDQAERAAQQGDTQSAEQLMRALEQELAQNPAMRDALDQIAEATSEAAREALEQASHQEGELADQVGEQSAAAGEAASEPGDPGQMGQAAQQQQQLTDQVAEAGQDLARAGRHQERLGDQPSAAAMQQQGQAAQDVAAGEMQRAAEALAENQALQPAAEALEQAAEALQELAQDQPPSAGSEPQPGGESSPGESGEPGESGPGPADQQAGTEGADGAEGGQPGPPQPGRAPSPSSPAESAQGTSLADALDQIDRMINSQPGQGQPSGPEQASQGEGAEPGSTPGDGSPAPGEGTPGSPSPLEQLLAEAARQQGQEMARQRAQQGQPVPGQPQPGQPQPGEAQPGEPTLADQPPPPGDGSQGAASPEQLLQGEQLSPEERWGRLPSQMAEDLIEGQRQSIAPEYRQQIEAYYRALAEKARER